MGTGTQAVWWVQRGQREDAGQTDCLSGSVETLALYGRWEARAEMRLCFPGLL